MEANTHYALGVNGRGMVNEDLYFTITQSLLHKMPIKSYLIQSLPGKKKDLQEEISAISECEVTPSENKDLLIVVTETMDEKADRLIFDRLNALENSQLLTLVSAFSNNLATLPK